MSAPAPRNRRKTLIPAAVAFAATAAGLVAARAREDAPPYVYASRYVEMRDGVRIAVDTYVPRDVRPGQRVPAILHQTRYYRAFSIRWPGTLFLDSMFAYQARIRRFTSRGYAYVLVDVRGAGASFGTRTRPWSHEEVDDGVELVRWITAQPWSDGSIGATGWSYDGIAAELLAARQLPAVKAIAPQYAFFDGYRDASFPGGIHLTTMTKLFESVTVAMDQNRLGRLIGFPARLVVRGVRPVDEDTTGALLRAAIRQHTSTERLHTDALRTEFRDDTSEAGLRADSLSPMSQAPALLRSRVPVYNWSGWYDAAIARSAIDRFHTAATPGSRLILGPWSHAGLTNLSPFASPPFAFDADGELLRFFDYHMKGLANGLDTVPRVRFFTMGEERWHDAATWPPDNIVAVPFFLVPGGALRKEGTHATADTSETLPLVISGTGHFTRWNPMIGGAPGRAKIDDRTAVDRALPKYDSAALDSDLVITGHPILTLHISTAAPDGEVFAYLDDVDERGVAHPVSEGLFRLVHRRLAEPLDQRGSVPLHSYLRRDASPMRPDTVEEIAFDLLPVSYLFRRGHRIRLAISGGDPDHFRRMTPPVASITVHYGELTPSRLDLPVAPAR